MSRQLIKEWPTLQATTRIGKTKFWQIRVFTDVMGRAFVETEYWQDDGAHQTAPKEAKGKNQGKANETSALQQALSEAESQFNKQRDKGYCEDGEVRDNPYLLPMLAHDFNKRGKDIIFPCFGQPKLDGFRALFTLEHGFWSRQGKPFGQVVDLTHLMFRAADYVLDGELILPKPYTFQQTCEAIKKQRDETALLEYHIFDVVTPNEMSYSYRLGVLQSLEQLFPPQVKLVATEMLHTRDDADTMLARYLEDGYEGLILRNACQGQYEVGQRSTHLQKYKVFQDAEYRVVGIVDGVGREEGAAILVCATEAGQQFQVRPRGDYETRRRWFQNQDELVGKMFKVRFQNLTDEGLPRFPVGIAVREDWDLVSETILTYGVHIGLVLSVAFDEDPIPEGDRLKEILAENAIDFITCAINESPAELAGFIDKVELIEVMNDEEQLRRVIELKVQRDHDRLKGQEVLVHRLDTLVGSDVQTLDFWPPIRVHIYPHTSDGPLHKWNDDWLDPDWDVKVLETHRMPQGFYSAWISGLYSYSLDGQEQRTSEWWTPDDYRDWMLEGV